MRKLLRYMLHKAAIASCALVLMQSCIEPPLHLPGETILVEMPMVETELNIVWDIDVDFSTQWYYGWDQEDIDRWGDIGYTKPTSFEVIRYYTGDNPNGEHTQKERMATVRGNSFRAFFAFGYYDMLFWSNIDSKDGTQVLVVNDGDDPVTATTTGTRGMSAAAYTLVGDMARADETQVMGMKNQPEIFYSAYTENVFISRNFDDYEYDAERNIYVKKIESKLHPLVYIYLVQIILINNDGRIKGSNSNCALSSMANGTNVNTGHTSSQPALVYFETAMKRDKVVDGQPCEIIGGKMTTFGLCDMDHYTVSGNTYNGSRTQLTNNLFFDLIFSNNVEKTYAIDVTEQCRRQAHGGIITVYVDCSQLEIPPAPGTGSFFVPTVEDYDEVFWDFEM